MKPLVSVVVPNYNHARYLLLRIGSILRQTYQDFEVIVLDDCSTDDSRDVLSRYAGNARVRIEFNEVNSGNTFKQWNKGVHLARGRYIWIAESDDYADERLLERLVSILEGDKNISYAYCRSWRALGENRLAGFEDSYFPYQGSHGWASDFLIDGRQECRDYFLFINPVPNASAALFRKDVYEAVGGADESMILCGDWKLWASIALQGRIAYISEPLNYYRWHDMSLRTRTSWRSGAVGEAVRVVRWILDRMEVSDRELIKVYEAHAAGWVPELMSSHIPLSIKKELFRYVRSLDPNPWRRIAAPAFETIRRSAMHRWRSIWSSPDPALSGRTFKL